jgi:tetratricopeptide (TPR) repeat protein
MEGSATQLADTRPQLDTPLRVAVPVNAPERISKLSRDQYIHTNAFSPHALAQARLKLLNIGNTDPRQVHNKKMGSNEQVSINMDHDAISKTAIRDFNLLAFSSKRSGKKDEEATAYASLGVIYDNQANFTHAIEVYKLYLQICEEIGDIIGSACACNCIGVNYLLLACPPSDTGCLQGVKLTPVTRDYLDKAAYYHTKHLEIGPDSGGKFVANTNLGLTHGMNGDINASAKHHQDALRTAIKMQTLYGQSIAVGNLGLLALVKGDYSTSRTCFDQVKTTLEILLFVLILLFLLSISSTCSWYRRCWTPRRRFKLGKW